MERYGKLFLALLVSALFIYLPIQFSALFNHYFSNQIGYFLMMIVVELIQLIGLIAFIKIVYLWIKELWKLK